DTVSRLIVALDRSARWCDQPDNHDHLSEILASPRYISAPRDIIRRVLAGEFSLDARGNRRLIPDYFVFHRQAANYPRADQALWIYSQMIRWGQVEFSAENMQRAQSAYRADLYHAALGADASLPDEAGHLPGASPDDRFMDGRIFDPDRMQEYVRGFAVGSDRTPPGGAGED
ncbi:MAG: ABC transporter substrate-binding protein, partial [Rhizobium rhizophilum]